MSSSKSPLEIAQTACTTAQTKSALSISQMLLLGILAGAYIAFGGFFYTVVTQDLAQYAGMGVAKLLGGASFTVGLILVVVAGGELFTGNCLMPLGALSGFATTREVLKNWFWVYVANFLGAAFVAFLLFESGLATGPVGVNALKIASTKMGLPFDQALVRGILCNWLVVLAVWMSLSASEVVSKVFAVFFPIMAFVASGFEHSIANIYFMTLGLLVRSDPAVVSEAALPAKKLAAVTPAGFLHNLVPVTIGNIIGGALFVAIFYFLAYRKVLVCKNAATESLSQESFPVNAR